MWRALPWLMLFVGCAAPAVPPDVPWCLQADARAVAREGGFDPAGAVVASFAGHDVVALGEFHRVPEEIDLLVSVLHRVDGAVDLGMELVPASAQADIDALLSTPGEFEPWYWWSVVGARHDLEPMDARDYLAVPRAVHALNQQRAPEDHMRLVGLQPDCRLASRPSADSVIACFAGRDASMADIARREVLARGRKLLLSAGTFHTALAMVDPEGEAWTTVAGELATTHRVAAFLPAGRVELETGAWGLTCDGRLEALGAALGRAYHLPAASLEGAGLDCLGSDATADVPLSEAYDEVLWLGLATGGRHPTPLESGDFRAMGDGPIAAWDAFGKRFKRRAPRGSAEGWAREAARELMRFTDRSTPEPPACPER